MSAVYDSTYIRTFFDEYGEREWLRHEKTPADEVSFHIHCHYLERFIGAGDRVLEAGAGPGRFTTKLARLGARVTVGDISKTQLALNERYVVEAGVEEAVEARYQLDITDLSGVRDSSFDAVVCYGGPLSYVLERGDQAVSELLRVMKPSGHLLVSVMSLVGATRMGFDAITTLPGYPGVVDDVTRTGLLTPDLANGQAMKLYRSSELKALLERFPCRLVAASAVNCLSVGRSDVMQAQRQEPALWSHVLAWERDLCAEAGNLDAGTHILVVVEKEDV